MPCEITVRSGKPVLAGRTVPSWDGLDLRHTCSAAAHSARFAHVDQLARWTVPSMQSTRDSARGASGREIRGGSQRKLIARNGGKSGVEGLGVSRVGVAGLKFSASGLALSGGGSPGFTLILGHRGLSFRDASALQVAVPACRGRWRSGGTRPLRAHWHLRVPRAASAPSQPVRVIAIWDFTVTGRKEWSGNQRKSAT